MYHFKFIQALLAYQQARKGKVTDILLVSMLGVRTNFLTLLRKGQRTGEEVSYGGIIRKWEKTGEGTKQKTIKLNPDRNREWRSIL